MRLLRAVPALCLALPMAAFPASAQQGAECPVDVYQPSPLAQASLTIGRVAQAIESPDAPRLLKDAMRFLQDEKKLAGNPVGTGFLKAQIYILWLHQPNVGETMTYEQLNLKGDKTQRVDLIPAADSLLKAVEALAPACAEQTLQWRGAKPWTDRINKAYTFLGADALDSAAYWAQKSAMLHPTSPFVHNIFAQLASKRGDTPTMLTHLRLAIGEAMKDTSLAETLSQMRFQLASTLQQYALAGGAASKAELLKEAIATYELLISNAPGGAEAAYAFSAATEIVMLSQDSVTARALIAPMLAEPTPFSDLTLLLAADLARMFRQFPQAMTLYASALAKNPNIRDASYFLAFLYYEAKQADKMLPLTNKLIEIDPSNGDNYLMKAYAYQLMAAGEKDPKKKAELVKQQDALSAQENAMPHKLEVTRFERRVEGAVLGGTIRNLSKTARAYTLKVDFLDIAGNVVESLTTEIASVKPNDAGTFELSPKTAGIVAYKYEALK